MKRTDRKHTSPVRWAAVLCMALALASCGHPVENPKLVDALPDIYPDYAGVTVPATIAPMNFDLARGVEHEWVDVLVKGSRKGELHVNARNVSFPAEEWTELLAANTGDSLLFTVSVKQEGSWTQFRPFAMYVSPHPIDYGVVYRKIAPGYELYSQMGIYERNLSTFEERPLLVNTLVKGMCVNCHSFNRTSPSRFSLHIRGKHGATLLMQDGRQELLDTKTDSTISACVYPYWHPSGNYIAYSNNVTHQSFHTAKDQRIEVFDEKSDLVVYHPESHKLLRSPLLQGDEAFETFPAFSADGRKLYFSSSKPQAVPKDCKKLLYNLCSIDFFPETGTFGTQVDTLVQAERRQESILFPRPSYDGNYLMYTRCDYGYFPAWHKEADLWLLDLRDGSTRPIAEVNSGEAESFHNWSSNSRWFLFSSRRDDGLYTRLYLASIDENGNIGKPFLLPQERPLEYYSESLYSYNVPDFVAEPVPLEAHKLEGSIVSGERVPLAVD